MTSPLLLALLALTVDSTPSEMADKAQLGARLKFMQETVAAIDIRRGKPAETKLDLVPQPILRWNSAQSRVVDAITVLWTSEGRPQAIGGMWIKDGIGLLELHSLSEAPLRATIAGKREWTPANPGIVWSPLPRGEKPAGARAERLRQLKFAARRFRVHAIKTAPDYDEGSVWKFRMLDQPLYHYDDQQGTSGAIFVFAQGTDPEAFLLLESRKANGGMWQYALVPACVWELHAAQDEHEIWTRAKEHRQREPDNVYYSAGPFRVDPELLPARSE
jgi:hypothetical protein